MAEELDDVVRDFLEESNELIEEFGSQTVTLERAPHDVGLLASMFRALHTIKGSCGFLEFARLERLTHSAENLLARLRDGKLAVDPELVRLLFDVGEDVRRLLATIEATGSDMQANIDGLVARIEARLAEPVAPGQPAAPPRVPAPADAPPATVAPATLAATASPAAAAPTVAAAPSAEATPDDPPATTAATATDTRAAPRSATIPPGSAPHERAGEPSDDDENVPFGALLVRKGVVRPEHVALAVQEQRRGDPRRLGEILVAKGFCRPEAVREALEEQGEHRAATIGDNALRVDVELLDALMNLVGELVLARNQVQQFTERYDDAELLRTAQRLDVITTELQEGVMKTRMQPIGTVWNKFPRVVRHLAVVCSKEVRLEMEGQDTELDKTIIEAIKDPLTHFVRNTVDHGIEDPEVRVRAGKPREGVVFLRAFHESGQVNIEISDDGRGIHPDVVRQKAVEKGIVSPLQASQLSDREVVNLVFRPGFSTAAKVSSVSGRGVGMDVVKTNIERIGGTVDLHSEPGKGTTLKIKIPLTLAIIPTLIVRAGEGVFALPQVSLLELVRIPARQIEQQVVQIEGRALLRLRGRLLPLIDCCRTLGLTSTRTADEPLNVVVLQAENRTFGLIVDEVRDTAEIVVKPLGKQLYGLPTFAGATIMGDGSVALIVDVLGLARHTGVLEEHRERTQPAEPQHANGTGRGARQSLLTCRAGEGRVVAVLLDAVDRLEEFEPAQVERARGRAVLQYRDTLLPLLDVGATLDGTPRPLRASDGGALRVLVHRVGHGADGRLVGLVVDEILDIVDEDVEVLDATPAGTIAFTASVRGRVTDVLDLPALLLQAQLHPPFPRVAA